MQFTTQQTGYVFDQLTAIAKLQAPKQIVFIDSQVPDYQEFVAGVVSETEVIILNPAEDGVKQITNTLSKYSNIYSSIHIISHGSPACLYLGNAQLSLNTLDRYARDLKTWSSPSLLLYGCQVAAGDAGREFIEKLHRLTGAEIAASKNYTGSKALGGDWELEVTTSDFETSLVLQPEVMQRYKSVLITLITSAPLDNGIGLPLNSNLVLTFSGLAQAGTGNITIVDAATGTPVETISVNDPNRVTFAGPIVTVNPSVDLASGQNYYVTIDPTAIRGLLPSDTFAGITNPTALNFSTAALPDLAAPTLIATVPLGGSVGLAVNSDLVLTFSELVQAGTGNISIIDTATNTALETIPINDPTQVTILGNTVTVNPSVALAPGQNYAVTIDPTAIRDLAGNAYSGITDLLSLNFATAALPDLAAPTLIATVPLGGSVGLAVNSDLVLTFSELVQAGTGNISIIDTATNTALETIPINDPTQVTILGNTVTVNPSVALAPGQNYAVTIDPTAIRDLAGNAYSGITDLLSLNFSTAALPDLAAPTLIATVPLGGSVGLAVNSDLVLTFSELVQAGTGNISIIDTATNTALETIPINDPTQVTILGNTVTVNPSVALAPGQNYAVTIDPTAIRDLAGNAYSGITDLLSLNFATAALPDLAAPTLIATVPLGGSVGLAVNSDLVLTFSELVQAGTGNISIIDTATNTALETIPINDPTQVTILGNTVTVNPSVALAPGQNYAVTIDPTAIRDLAGNAYSGITDLLSLNFATAALPDLAAPTLIATVPLGGSVGLAVNSDLVLTFSELVQAGTGNISIIDTATNTALETIPINDPTQVTILGNTVTVNPSVALAPGQNYAVTIDPTAIRDLAGNAYSGITDLLSLNFSTAALPDLAAPTLIATVPLGGSVGLAVNSDLVLTFSELVQAGTGNISIIDTATNTALETIPINDPTQVTILGNTVTVNPSVALAPGQNYAVTIDPTAIRDLAGNAYSGITDLLSLNFATAALPDLAAPTLIATAPLDNSIGLPVNSGLVLTFSELVQAGTGNITIVDAATGTPFEVIPINDPTQVTILGNTVSVNPAIDLAPGRDYSVTIDPTAIRDLAGNAYSGITDLLSLNFSTAALPDLAAPTLIATAPLDNSIGLAVNSNLVLTFSELVQAGTGNITIVDAATGTPFEVIPINDPTQVTILGNTVTVNPAIDLAPGQNYSVTIDPTAIRDLAGNAYSGITDLLSLNFSTSNASDLTAPTLISTNPADNSVGLAVNSNLVLTFSELVQAGTGNITIVDAVTGTPFEVIPINDPTQVTILGNTVTVNPAIDLAPGQNYSVTIDPTAIRDLAGNAYSGITDLLSLNFSTAALPDLAAPTLIATAPLDNSIGLAVNSNLVLTFSELVQAGTGNITIVDAATGTPFEVIPINDPTQVTILGNTVTVNPAIDLAPGQNYSVTIDPTAIRDLAGNAYSGITDLLSLNFSTSNASDLTAPTLISTNPADNSVGLAVNSNLVLTFSELVQAGTGNITIVDAVTGTPFEVIPINDPTQVTILGNTVTVNPAIDLAPGQNYSVTIDPTAIRDLAGNAYSGITDLLSLNFSTAALPDLAAPTLIATAPLDNSIGLAVNSNLVLTFSELVQAGTGNITIVDAATGTPFEVIPINDPTQVTILGNTVTVNPAIDLAPGQNYSVTIDPTAIRDLAGNAYSGITDLLSLNFSTAALPDLAAPTLIATAPLDNSIGLAVNSNLVLTFSELVQAGTGNITIVDAATGTPFEVIPINDPTQVTILGNTVTVNPAIDLAPGQNYSVTIDPTAIRDLAGNAYSGITDLLSLNFSTAALPDLGAPTLIATAPLDNSIGLPVNSGLVLTFSELVQAGTGNITIVDAATGTPFEVIPINDPTQVTILGNTVSVNPAIDLAPGQNYSVTIDPTAIRDLAGNAYSGITDLLSLNFSTAALPDLAAPTLIATAPLDNSIGLAVNSNLVLTFSELVQAGTGNITIVDAATGTPFEVIPINDPTQVTILGNTVTVNPAIDLAPGQNYSVTIDPTAIRDLAGNAYSGITDLLSLNFSTSNASDLTAPTLISTNPADNSVGLAVNSNLVLSFSETVQAGTGNITVFDAATNTPFEIIPINDPTQVSVLGNTVSVNPAIDLAPGRDYYVNVDSGAIRDLAGNVYSGITNPTTLNFSSAAAPDLTAPTIISTNPADNSVGLAVNSNLVLSFSEAVQAGTGNITVFDAATNTPFEIIPINDPTQVSVLGNTVSVNPAIDLAPGRDYYVNVDSGAIRDLAGNVYSGITNPTTLNFSSAAAPDLTAPTIISTNPADNSVGLAVNSNLVLSFSEAVQAGTGNITVFDAATNTPFEIIPINDPTQVSVLGNTVSVNPAIDLAPGRDYYVNIDPTAIRDLAGNAYSGITNPTTLNFSSAAAPDLTAPTIISTNPADNSLGLAVNSNLVLSFSEAVQAGTGNITVFDAATNTPFEIIPINDPTQVRVLGNTVSVNPAIDLAPGRDYYVNIDPTAIRDLAGNAYSGITNPTTLNFSSAAVADTIAPALVSNTPANNSTGLPVNSNLVLDFSEPVQAGTGNITVFDGATNTPVETISVNDPNRVTILGDRVIINPSQDLAPSRDYFLNIDSGAIRDLAGNTFSGITDSTTLKFSSAATADTTAPALISNTPANNSTGLPVNSNLVFGFNEPIQAGTGNITVFDAATNTPVETISVNDPNRVNFTGNSVAIDPSVDLAPGRDYFVNVDSGAIRDLAGNTFSGITDSTTLKFSTSNVASGVNNAPTLASLISDRNIITGHPLNFSLPANTFTDIDPQDTLTYSATLNNGAPLPNWLTFDSATQTFSGVASINDIGTLNVKVTATDAAGATASDTFNIGIGEDLQFYRFRNKTLSTGTYLFVGKAERDAILVNPEFNQTFELEGGGNLAFDASSQPGEGLLPFYRLLSKDVPGTYLFAGPDEYNGIFAPTSDQNTKWIKEGLDAQGNDIAEFYLFGVGAGQGIPFNRFQNKQTNTFLFAGPEETAAILANPDFSNVFTNQGGAFETFI